MGRILVVMAIAVHAFILSGCATTLQDATTSNDIDSVRKLIAKGENVNALNELGKTPLNWAAVMGRKDIVELLLEKGADINGVGRYSGAALHGAAQGDRNIEITKLLIARDAKIDMKDPQGRTPLFEAVSLQSVANVTLLIDKGADINKPGPYGYTPLMWAVNVNGARHPEIVRLLIAKGADTSIRNKIIEQGGKNALEIAQENGNAEVINALTTAQQNIVAAQQKHELTTELKTLIAKKDMQGLRTYLDAHPEALPTIEDAHLRLLFTGPTALRITDIAQLVKNQKKDAIIIAKINSTSAPYKNFTDAEMTELNKMGISDDVVAAMITVTAEYDKEQKRLSEQQRSQQMQQVQQPVVVAAQSESNTPAECIKLIAALKACDQAGGFLAMGCKSISRSKFDCPAVEKYMR